MAQFLSVIRMISALLTFNLCGAKKIEILNPVRATGDEVALIFTTAENGIKGEQYRQVAQAIQNATHLRLWVALNEASFTSIAGLYKVPRTPSDAISALKKAGMTSKNYVGVAHGEGADFLLKGAPDSELKAVIVMGHPVEGYLSSQDYPLPVLTLAGELDGIWRITRMAEQFSSLKQSILKSFANLYRTPIFLVEGTNHAQFASGTMPLYIVNNDLVSMVTEEKAHQAIGEYVNDFLVTTFSSSPSKVDEAMKGIEKSFAKTVEKFQPILDVKALDVNDGNFSRWTVIAQEFIAGQFASQIEISNYVEKISFFSPMRPSVMGIGDKVSVNTITFEGNREDTSSSYLTKQSPYLVLMKLMSKDAIWDALADQDNGNSMGGPRTSLRSEPITCQNLNKLALQIALNFSSPEAQKRYKDSRRPLIFGADIPTRSEWTWSILPLLSREDQLGLFVRSVSYARPITSTINPGVLYCKVITPSLAMEWINVDSIRAKAKIG